MFVECYLGKGTVYVPTVVRQASSPIYNTVEPIAVVPLDDSDAVRAALLDRLNRGNAIVPDRNPRDRDAPPAILKYARVRSWSACSFELRSSGASRRRTAFIRVRPIASIPKAIGKKIKARKFNFHPGQYPRMSSTA